MPSNIWGVTNRLGLDWPAGALEYALLALGVGLLGWAWRRGGGRRGWRPMTRPQWATFVALCGASLLLSQLFPLSIPWSNPLLRASPLTGAVALLAAVPYLLAGLALPVPAAIVVGLLAGLGRALGQTGQPLDVVAVGLAAGLSAALLRQSYTGRLSGALRRPAVAGAVGRLLPAAATGLGLLVAAWPTVGFFSALDLALFFGLWSLVPLLIEGVVGGLLASVALWVAPQWRPEIGRVPSPWQRTLQRQLVAAFLTFAALVVLLSAMVAFYFSARATERTLVEEMVSDVTATAARLAGLEGELAAVAAAMDDSPTPEAARSALGRLGPATPFSDVRLMRPSGEIIVGPANGLTPAEQAAAADALRSGRTRWAAGIENGQPAVALAAVGASEGQPVVVLARVARAALADLLVAETHSGQSEALIVDERGQVVAARGATDDRWTTPTAEQVLGRVARATGHTVYATTDPTTGARQLLVYAPVPSNGWKVVAAVPNAVILRTTLGIIGPLAALLLAVTGLFYALVASLGRGITRPIAEMGQASRAIAGGGGLERPVRPQREDEIGQLSLAFSQMQRALRQRLDELSLLLSVSNEVAATIHIDEGMAAVLQGVLRGTGGAGARAIVRNPQAPTPLIFAEGPAAESMVALDRAVLLSLRNRDELAYSSALEIEEGLGVVPSPAAALFARPLRPGGEFQGVLYVVYRQPHYFDSDERGLLQTLAGQATVLVQNAHLFAAAESGRRRLAAVLASASNAIIVTDPTDRVLFVNPAMERAFGLNSRDVGGRAVGDALAGVEMPVAPARRLSLGLTGANDQSDVKLEVEANGRSFLAAVATVASHEGQTMGRVAVLQDVTELKEVDRLKSEFLAGVSHDLLSPLTYMHNYAAMLPIMDDPALEREAAGKILGGIERLKTLVNDLLDMARIEAGLNLQFDRVDVGDLLAEVAQEYASPARAAGLRPVVECPGDLPPAPADPTLLRRAVTNLVTNALKYAPQSGPLLLRAEATDKEIIISVRDHGPGISATDRAHLFEKFYRGGEITAGRARGSGLGLAIVKSVADLHGGRAWCQSEPGQGSAFFLALPRAGRPD